MNKYISILFTASLLCGLTSQSMAAPEKVTPSDSTWLLVDNFETSEFADDWGKKDTRNDTSPHVPNPQVTELVNENKTDNTFLINKPAAEGVIGNRKALTFKPLPKAVGVGETYTFFTRINIEYFPNNHVFGLSNLDATGIEENDYNALEPSLRITDKRESNGFKNDGALMVKTASGYSNVQNYAENRSAKPLQAGVWYDIWYVVNNAKVKDGGQHYDVYVRGSEFTEQTLVYKNASFRMKRELPLIYFMMNCNTGPIKKPYGNGGLRYDDIYMSEGTLLSSPI